MRCSACSIDGPGGAEFGWPCGQFEARHALTAPRAEGLDRDLFVTDPLMGGRMAQLEADGARA